MTALQEKPAKSAKPAAEKSQPAMPALYEKLARAHKVGTPIVAIATSDPAQATRNVIASLTDAVAVITYDLARGFAVPGQPTAMAEKAKTWMADNSIDGPIGVTSAIADFAPKAERLMVTIVYQANRFFDDPTFVQAVWNLRDDYKSNRRMIILMGTNFQLPPELRHDVVEFDEPLPTRDELRRIMDSTAETVKQTKKGEIPVDVLDAAATAAQGLNAFAAEQLSFINLKSGSLSVDGIWDDKCKRINETPGLKVIKSGKFSDVAGVEAAKEFFAGILKGKDAPACIVYVDEIEKSLGGAANDTSGVSQDQLGVLLQDMQDTKATGALLYGFPGTCKSQFAKVCGGEVGIPCIQLDLGGMKGSLVGQSEERIREALKVIRAISGGKTLWLATCNSLTVIPPELRRRFKYGTWFFDLPSAAERVAIWSMYCTKYEIEMPGADVLDINLTGAEIESACEIAWRTGMSLQKITSSYVVPLCRSMADQIKSMRANANGKFLSAGTPGVYSYREATQEISRREID